VQVRGVSLGWSNTNWEPAAFFNANTVNAMVDSWKAQIIRVPIGYSENGGYQTDQSNLTRVKIAVNAAIAKGVYVIIDWHSHNAHNETAAAKNFFETTLEEYHNVPNVIFELYNEPTTTNGGTWANVRSYATTIIDALRAKGANNLILVGTPSWCQDVNAPLSNPIADDNIAYVVHFYAYTHPLSGFSSKINAVLSAGYPVFASEYGTTDADGGDPQKSHYNTHNASNTDAWHTYMDNNKISSCAWNINDKYEGAAFFGISQTGRFTQTAANFANESMMTASGKYIFNMLRTCAGVTSAPVYDTPLEGGPWYCDMGYKTTEGDERCFQIASESECNARGIVAASCGRTDLIYCDWGRWSGQQYDPNTGTGGGGCWRLDRSNADEYSNCQLNGNVVSQCPTTSL
jgi:endoglucanase